VLVQAEEPVSPNGVESANMTFWKADHQPKQARWALAPAARWRRLATIRAHLWQWSIAVAVGLVLALYLLVAIPWKPRWAPFLALAALFPFVVMIVGDVRKLLLAVILLELPLHLDVNLLYDGHAVALAAIGGLNISITTFCLAVLYALWWAELMTKATRLSNYLRASLPLVAYLAAVTLSTVVAQNARLALFEIFLLVQSFLLFIYVIKSVRSRQDLLFVVTLLLIGLVLESLIIIGLRILGHSISIARIKAGIDAGGRVSGTLGSPNTAASYLSLLLAPALGAMLTPLERRYKWLAALAFGLGSVALALTFSRGGWLAFILSVTLLCLSAFIRGWLSPRVLLTAVVAVVLLFLLFRGPILARLYGDDLGAASSRVTMARQALRVIEANPLLGVGANNYATWYEQHPAPEIDRERLLTVHNKYLLVWAETGAVGLVAFLGFLLAVIRRGWQVWQLEDRSLSPLALGLTVAIVGQMVHMFADLFHNRPQVQLLWLVAGLITAIHYLGQKRTEEDTK
jgi:putative inorganic carbon (HCO3(-)) transporter